MAKISPFDKHPDDYDRWFDEHALIYEAELKAVDVLLPPAREGGLEVRVGSGKFASRLRVPVGTKREENQASSAGTLISILPVKFSPSCHVQDFGNR